MHPRTSADQPSESEPDSLYTDSASSIQQPSEAQPKPIESSQQLVKPKKKRKGPSRGPSRALKYKKLRRVQPKKLVIEVPENLGRPVGEHALQFIGECVDWVKEYCPLNVENWHGMPKEALAGLFEKVKSNYVFVPSHRADKVIHTQCSNLFRCWRERLKSKHFKGKSLEEAECSCPNGIDKEQWRWLVYSYWGSSKQKDRSKTNRENGTSKKILSACGAKSIARVVHEIQTDIELQESEPEDPGHEAESASMPSTSSSRQKDSSDDQPFYIKVWDKTKRHKDGYFDEEGEIKMEEFQKLHEKQIQEQGADNLSLEEAFEHVLGYRSGYARGLGQGHRVLDKEAEKTKAEMEAKIQHLTQREQELLSEIERLRLDSKIKEEEALERDRKREEEVQAMEERLHAEMETKIQDLVRRLLLSK